MNAEDVAADFTSESMNFASGGVVKEGWDPAVDDVSKLDTRFNPPIVRNVQFTWVHLTDQELRKIVREELEAVFAARDAGVNQLPEEDDVPF
jgi:hypothetical protein